MTLKEQRQRDKLIYDLHNLFMSNLHKEHKIAKLKAMADIAIENQAIRNSIAPCFLFEGRWYTYPYNYTMPTDRSGLDRTLDSSLLNRVYAITRDKKFEEKIIYNKVKVLFGDALDTCRAFSCLKLFIPTEYISLSQRLLSDVASMYTIGDALTQEEITAFKDKHSEGFKALKSLQMMKLLMAKIGT